MEYEPRSTGDDTRDVPTVPDFIALAGTISVPDGKRKVGWDEVIRQTRAERSRKRHRLGGVDHDEA